jgi:hypothetical protein
VFGRYDIKENIEIFTQRLYYLFGPDAKSINCSVQYLNDSIPMLISNISRTTVFAFRRLANGPKVVTQFELLFCHYAMSFFLPVLDRDNWSTDWFLLFCTRLAYHFGNHLFAPTSPFHDYLLKTERADHAQDHFVIWV